MAQYTWPPVSIASGPVQFVLDAVNTNVSETTANEALSTPLPVKVISSVAAPSYVTSVRKDYSATAVTSAAWVQLIASTGAKTTNITVFDSGGYAMEIGVGAAASESRVLLIPPGGINGVIPLLIAAGSRVSVRAVGAATVNAGELDINLLG